MSSTIVPKVVYGGTTFVFLGQLARVLPDAVKLLLAGKGGDIDHADARRVLGAGYKKYLGIGSAGEVRYMPQSLRRNDNIGVFRKRLCHYLGLASPDDMYIWFHRDAQDPALIHSFLNNVFKRSPVVRADVLVAAARAHFGVELELAAMANRGDAARALMEAAPKLARCPLLFQYMFDGYVEYFDETTDVSSFQVFNNFPLLLGEFDAHDDVYHLVVRSKGEEGAMFPFPRKPFGEDDRRFVQEVDRLEDAIEAQGAGGANTSTVVNFVHIRGDLAQPAVDLEVLFNELESGEDIPFIKFKTPLNMFYKVHKRSLPKISGEDISRWTKVTAAKDDKSFLVMKMAFPGARGCFCSLAMNADLSYSVKINLSIKEAVGVPAVEAFLPRVNGVLSRVAAMYPGSFVPLLPKGVLGISAEAEVVRTVQMITSSVVSSLAAKPRYSGFGDVLRGIMYPYFNIIETKDAGILHLQYKKVSNYTKIGNISTFISHRSGMPRDELVRQVMTTFMVPMAEAEREVEAYSGGEGEWAGRGRLGNEMVSVKVRLNDIDMRYMLVGISAGLADEVRALMEKLLVIADSKKKEKRKVDVGLIDRMEEAVAAQPVVRIESPIDDVATRGLSSDGDDDIDDDLRALQEEFAEEIKALEVAPSPKEKEAKATPAAKKEDDDAPVKVKGYVLNKLYEADRNLFKYRTPPDAKRKDYASLCGWVDRRQPVAVSKKELERINREFPQAVDGHVKAGSTPELYERNHYICPKVWCPKSRVALSAEDFERLGRCPYPEVDEEPIVFASKTMDLKRDRYPGYLDKYTHPDQMCLPCCFKVKSTEGNRNKQRGDMCVPPWEAKKEEEKPAAGLDEVASDRYIKGANYSPLEQGRLGLLPPALVAFLGQDGKQGNRHDGTGVMTDATDAFFRKGIYHTDQSYLDAIAAIVGMAGSRSVLSTIIDHMDVHTYISLEGGRIMKMFVDTTRTVYDEESFRAFYMWFREQKGYISRMNLERLLVEVEGMEKVRFSREELFHHQDILREYIIYQSYKNFLEFLKNDRMPKEHLVMSDLVCNRMQRYINANRYNIVHLEYSIIRDKIYFQCVGATDKNYPFVFLMKRGAYYEPIVHARMVGGEVEDVYQVMYKDAPVSMKKLMDFVMDNCRRTEGRANAKTRRLAEFLRASGYKPKYYVLDYGYRVCGIVVNHNLYVPLEDRDDMYFDEGIKYVYISDVPSFRCMLDRGTISGIFKKIERFTGSAFYRVASLVTGATTATHGAEKQLVGVVLGGVEGSEESFVPVNLRAAGENKVYTTFRNGLFVLVGHEGADRRMEVFERFKREAAFMEGMSSRIRDRMEEDPDLRMEVEFLLDRNNPLPILYKKERLVGVLQKIGVAPGEIDEASVYKIAEYMKDGRHFKMYNQRTRRFRHTEAELLLDHYDVMAGKLAAAAEFAENPHKAFLGAVEAIEREYIFKEQAPESEEQSEEQVVPMSELVEVPVRWRKTLRGFKAVDLGDGYTSRYIFDIMEKVSRAVGGSLDNEMYLASLRNRAAEAFAAGRTEEVLDNPWMKDYLKRVKKGRYTLEDVMDAMESPMYYPSSFDVRVMAELAHVNLVLLGRKTTRNPEGFDVVDNGSDIYVILVFAYDRAKVIDTFSVVVGTTPGTKGVFFRNAQLPSGFLEDM